MLLIALNVSKIVEIDIEGLTRFAIVFHQKKPDLYDFDRGVRKTQNDSDRGSYVDKVQGAEGKKTRLTKPTACQGVAK